MSLQGQFAGALRGGPHPEAAVEAGGRYEFAGGEREGGVKEGTKGGGR